ncbi:MAG: hypothetical protein VKK42_17655 [Lyngbya sp.]|nr:hypothetical protein [Lyngbya sp.]
MCDSNSEIIQRTIEYMMDFLEQPHPVFGGLPVCPFTRKARLTNQILYKVDDFDVNSVSCLLTRCLLSRCLLSRCLLSRCLLNF